jgi:hypothetical protein
MNNAMNRRYFFVVLKPMSMKKIFLENPYQQSLVTRVAEVDGDRLLFAETIAFSFLGGQESDKATVNGLSVLDSKMHGHLIYYTLPAGHGLSVGDEVTMEIDWPRRHRLMRLHFAAELVLEIVTRRYGFVMAHDLSLIKILTLTGFSYLCACRSMASPALLEAFPHFESLLRARRVHSKLMLSLLTP